MPSTVVRTGSRVAGSICGTLRASKLAGISMNLKEGDGMRVWSIGLTLLTAAVLVLRAPGFAAEPMPAGVTADEVKSAKTPEQHQAIADAYAKEAANLRAMADA